MSPGFQLARNNEHSIIEAANEKLFKINNIMQHFEEDSDRKHLQLHLEMFGDSLKNV